MSSLKTNKIYKRYDDVEVLNDISLSVENGEFIALVGPSGCGKSTLLRIIAGLEEQDAGNIELDNQSIDHIRAGERNLSMVFQSYALYPHLTVRRNIATPLMLRDLSFWQQLPFLWRFFASSRQKRESVNKRVEETAALLDIEHLLERKPKQLSGGQRQRVAVGRALVRQPKAFLLDEPLSNLDAKLRVQMRLEISQLHRQLNATFIYVTHDQSEAMTMADRIAIIMDGEILQCDSPSEIYNNPCDQRVAEFIGSPAINILPVSLVKLGAHIKEATTIGVRAEAISIVQPESDTVDLVGQLSHVENLGSEQLLYVNLTPTNSYEQREKKLLVIKTHSNVDEKANEWNGYLNQELHLALDRSKMVFFDQEGKALQRFAPLAEVSNG